MTVPGKEERRWQKAGYARPDECLVVAPGKSFRYRAGWKGMLAAAKGGACSSYLPLGCSSESFPTAGALLPAPRVGLHLLGMI